MRVELDSIKAIPALRTMPPEPKRSMRKALALLGSDPSGRTAKLDVKALEGYGELPMYRLRVGEWRAAFTIAKDRIRVLRIFHRSEGYDWVDYVRLGKPADEDIKWRKKSKS